MKRQKRQRMVAAGMEIASTRSRGKAEEEQWKKVKHQCIEERGDR